MNLLSKPILTTFLVLFFWSNQVFSFSFSFSNNIFSAKPGSNRKLILTNNGNKFSAIEVSILSREEDINGKEKNEVIEDDFIIYPSQVLLNANQEQVVTIRWAGDSNINKEIAYRLALEELPISDGEKLEQDIGKSKAMVKVLRRYLKSMYVTPEGAKANVKLIDAKPIETKKKEQVLEILVENTGNMHSFLDKSQIEIESIKDGTIKKFHVPKIFKSVNVLANNKRKFTMSWPEEVTFGPVKVRWRFQ